MITNDGTVQPLLGWGSVSQFPAIRVAFLAVESPSHSKSADEVSNNDLVSTGISGRSGEEHGQFLFALV